MKPNALLFTGTTKENVPPATATFDDVVVNESLFEEEEEEEGRGRDGGDEEAQRGRTTRTRKRQREQRHSKEREQRQKKGATTNSSFSTLFDDVEDYFYQ